MCLLTKTRECGIILGYWYIVLTVLAMPLGLECECECVCVCVEGDISYL